MTRGETLHRKLSEWAPAGYGTGGRPALTAALDGWAARVAVDKVDAVGGRVWELSLTRAADDPVAGPLKDRAAALAARATGLLEPLAVHEVDEAAGVALLRSTAPAVKAGAASYYEVVLTATAVELRRYRADRAAGTRREQVAFAVTHEAVGKFADDATS